MAKNPPVVKFKLGSITANIWRNESSDGRAFYATDLIRGYTKEGRDDWHETHDLRHQDLLNASRLLQRAETWSSEQNSDAQ